MVWKYFLLCCVHPPPLCFSATCQDLISKIPYCHDIFHGIERKGIQWSQRTLPCDTASRVYSVLSNWSSWQKSTGNVRFQWYLRPNGSNRQIQNIPSNSNHIRILHLQTQYFFFDHNKYEKNTDQRKSWQLTNIWKLNYMFLNNQ